LSCNVDRNSILFCLLFAEDITYSQLKDDEKVLADGLVKFGFLKKENEKILYAGYQLISVKCFYLLIDGKDNFTFTKANGLYIGVDSYLMDYYIDTSVLSGNIKCLDICTGTGVSALSQSLYSENVQACDISDEAIKIATFNCFLNKKEKHIKIKKEDMCNVISNEEKFDLITCNPPFIAFPPGLNGPIYAKGVDDDGLGYYRLILNNLNNILTDNGIAVLVGDFIGDEKSVYFISELNQLSYKNRLSMDLFIDYKLSVEDQLTHWPYYILKEYNSNLSIDELKIAYTDFIKNKMNAKYYYLTTILIKRCSSNPKFRVFNRFI